MVFLLEVKGNREIAMSERKKRKKLKRDEIGFHVAKASDFPHAPGLIARMYEEGVYVQKKFVMMPEDACGGKK